MPMSDFFDGLRYMKTKEYDKAIICFENCKRYKHLVHAYARAGYYDVALDLADTYGYYKLGASLAQYIGNKTQVAYFHRFFNPKRAAQLYRDLKDYYEAGYCYLTIHDGLNAIDMFMRCTDKVRRLQGLKQVVDYARTLYFKKDYLYAFRIFFELEDFYSALECAYKMKEKSLIQTCKILIGYSAVSKQDYAFAAKCFEEIDPLQASCFYAKSGDIDRQVEMLLKNQNYKRAMLVCCYHNDLNKAYEIASCYDPELLSQDFKQLSS